MTCIAQISFCKGAAEVKERGANLVVNLARRWAPGTAFAIGKSCRPADVEGQTGLEYSPGAGGYSNGAIEPKWPTVTTGAKSTVKDGSITWQAQALSNDSMHERIQGVTWEIPAGIIFTEVPFIDTPAEQSIGGQWSGGSAGKNYVARALVVTTLANKKIVEFLITIDPVTVAA